MNFRKVNNITGWVVFLIALATYMMTREARGSLWDCGEFVSSAYKMELPHPPGAPMFTILGRFFIILFGDNGQTAANAVNFMSAMASAATILFLFWSITHFARKMFVNAGEQLTGQQTFTVMAAGAVGALAYTFSDSFWFSAVEGEVYALSSFFTALVFWAMLKWEHADEHAGMDVGGRARADRWIIFLFFMMGLSIGVHILNLLSIPSIVMIYYFRRHFKYAPFKNDVDAAKKDQLLVWTGIVTVGLILLLIIANVLNRETDLMGIAMVFGFIGVIVALIRIYAKYKTMRDLISAFAIGCIITGIVQVGVIQYSMKAAGIFDVFFVNSLSLPFFSGFTIYFLALAAVIVWAFRFNDSNVTKTKLIIWFILFLGLSALPFIVSVGSAPVKVLKFLVVAGVATLIGYFFRAGGLRILRLCLWCYAFMMLGYFMYFTALIRSNANPTIDMNNVDNPISLVYYLSREQYGSAPLVYGPHFDADYELDNTSPNGISMKKGEMKYVRSISGKDRYIETGTEDEPRYRSKDMQLFPRIWDRSNDQGHFNFYISWLDLKQGDETSDQKGRALFKPTYADNANWFITYQMGLMYWRYFMWNFAGKQNDIQGLGSVRDGNWISGISLIDNNRLGDQDKIPDSIKDNKAHNKMYMLPFILGILGCVYQFMRNKKDWLVNFLLFFFTGIAVVLYLNQPGNQPRERDYAYVGSFYAFAIWIGLAVVAFVKMAREKENKKLFNNVLLYGSILTLVITLMSALPSSGNFGSVLVTIVGITALYALVTSAITYIVRAASSKGQHAGMLNIATTVICLIVPLIMGMQEWDDHDRSRKTVAPDLAKDYLESCAKNAVLITFGDNDTYPLWYAQEVENVRPDIRIINNSLLGIDWYINQLRYKVNDADSLDVIWTPEQIEGHKREYLRYRLMQGADQNAYYPLYDVMKNVLGAPDIDKTTGRDKSDPETFPVPKLSVPVDEALVRSNGTVNPDDVVVPQLAFEIPEGRLRGLQRNDLIILNIIASNNWKRPLYFTSPLGLGFDQYLRKEGMAYRLVPVLSKSPQLNWAFERTMDSLEQKVYRQGLAARQVWDNNDTLMFRNLMGKFEFGGANKKGVYFDEENRRHLLNIRSAYAEAAGNLADKGKKDEAIRLLEKADAGIPASSMAYGMVSRYSLHNQTGLLFLEACYKAGKADLAERVRKDLRKDIEDQQKYYAYIKAEKPEFAGNLEAESVFNDVALTVLSAIEQRYAPQTQPAVTPAETTPTIENPIKSKDSSTKNKPDSH